jgi:hypothetical protein
MAEVAEILPEAINEPGWRRKMAVVCGAFPPVDCLAVCVVLGMLMSGGNGRDGRWAIAIRAHLNLMLRSCDVVTSDALVGGRVGI